MLGRKDRESSACLARVRAVILAAGGSSRMGRPKALLEWGGRTILQAHLEMYASEGLELVVVGGAEWERLLPVCRSFGASAVRNKRWSSTFPVDSLRLALEFQSEGWSRCLVTPVDSPPSLLEI